MQTFCPHCANSLTIAKSAPDDNHPTGLNRLTCRTCPYAFPIDARYFERKYMKRKEVDDVLEEGGGKGMDIAEVQCTRDGCDNAQASFYQVQIRSADEPMTTFYKCTSCGQRWKEN